MKYIYGSSCLARKRAIQKRKLVRRYIVLTLLVLVGIPTAAFSIPSKTVYVNSVMAETEELEIVPVEPEPTIEINSLEFKSETIREVTMYSSTPHQTDSSPCIGSSGENQCELWRKGVNICATNAFPRGTILDVDKLGTCVVKDAMNKRYANRIDWYAGYDEDCLDGVHEGDSCPTYERALKFGTQKLAVKVYSRELAAR